MELPRKVIIIRDIIEETSEEEIKEAIVDKTGIETHKKDIKINTLRATKKGDTMVATVSLHKKKAEEIIKIGRIKIGWQRCRISEILTWARNEGVHRGKKGHEGPVL